MCAELAGLAMQLARAAAARAVTDWAEPEAPPAQEPLLPHEVESPADRETALQPNPTHRRTAGQAASTASYKSTDPAVLFTRLAAVARDCIALEARLAAGVPGAPSGRTRRADTRRTPVHEAIRASLDNHPDRAELLRKAATRLDEHLAADPDQTIDGAHVLYNLCDELGIELNLAKLPDKYLFALSEPRDDDELDPRATSPP